MANVSLGWEVEGIITADESVAGMLRVVEQKTFLDTGTFWTWEGNVSFWCLCLTYHPTDISPAPSMVKLLHERSAQKESKIF